MFGNKKMYKKGIADASQAYQDFAKKQEEAIAKIREEWADGKQEIKSTIDKFGDDLVGMYKYLDSKEKSKIYKLYTPFDIRDLENDEKQLLLAILYQLAHDEQGGFTEYQKSYILSVQHCLKITNPQTEIDLSVIENIDSLDIQRAFLQVVLEFLYLQNEDEITDVQEEFIDHFSVSKKQGKMIEDNVSRLFNLMGYMGLVEKYGDPDALDVDIQGKIEKFRHELEELKSCAATTCTPAHIDAFGAFTEIDIASFTDYISMRPCQEKAKQEYRKMYDVYAKRLKEIVSTSSGNSFYMDFRDKYINKLQEIGPIIDDLRTEENKEIWIEIRDLLRPDAVMNELKAFCEREGSNYRLKSCIIYMNSSSSIEYTDIEEDENEGSIAKLVRGVALKATKTPRYSYTIDQNPLDSDFEQISDEFWKSFQSEAKTKIISKVVDPIQKLLPQLIDSLK